MKGQHILIGVLALGLLLALAVGLSQAQELEPPEGGANRTSEVEEAAAVGSGIPIQGRLTDASGSPLNGTYSTRFRLYDAAMGGTVLCEDTNSVSVENGLFYSEIWGDCGSDNINGQQLYLGIKVEDDDEMENRQAIYPVPYAFSLRPGAQISGTVSGSPVLNVRNSGSAEGSSGVRGYATAAIGLTYGVRGISDSPNGRGVYGSAESGVGVYGLSSTGYGGYFNSTSGVALRAAGSGIIRSTANSYLWISGNGLQKANSDDTTRWEYDDYGGYKVYGGADWGNLKRVVLPVTIPGQLYGQDVTVTGIDLYHAKQGEFARIDAVFVRRQDGVGTGDLILYDDTDLICSAGEQCSTHWDLTQNNVLSSQQGILHIVLRFAYGGESDYIQIGGVRLTLEHD